MQGNVNIPDSTITTNLSFRQLVLMNMQQLTNFPYIENDFDALTDYELLCLVVKYLNDVIANQNEQNDSITRMYESFLELQTYVNNTKDTLEDAFNSLDDYVRNYFDNLDVQDEINNKLDEMLEDGVLEQIIEQFLQSTAIWCFDTVADMKAATNLISGSDASTLGYYIINDGGGALYHITDIESLTDYQEELNSGLYATLIINNEMNVKQFGAKGDGETDDRESIQTCINNVNRVIIPSGNFAVEVNGGDYDAGENSGLIIGDNKHIILDNNAYVKAKTTNVDYYKLFNIKNADNVHIEGGHIYGDKLTHTGSASSEWCHALAITDSTNVLVENCDIAYAFGDSICITAGDHATETYCENVTIRNCQIHDARRQGISIIASHKTTVENCEIYNISGIAPQCGIDIEANFADTNPVKNVSIINCNIHDTTGNSITTTSKTENVLIANSKINNLFNVNAINVVCENSILNNVASGSINPTIVNNSILYKDLSTYNGGKLTLNNCKTYERLTTTADNNEVISLNNCEINFINSESAALFVIRPTNSLIIDGCTINYDKNLCATFGDNISVTNSILNPQLANLDGFYGKHITFKNNIVNNYVIYRVGALQDGTAPSYVTNNIFKNNPSSIYGGTSSQYLFVTNNISPAALTTGTFTHVISANNYNNSTT